jgi:transglutaminase-like putative cysteine protease
VHVSPRAMPGQIVRHHSLLVEPAPVSRQESFDAFGNIEVILDIEDPHHELVLLARSTVEKLRPPPIDLSATTPWDELDYRLLRAANERDVNILFFRCASRLTTPTLEIADYAALSFAPSRPVLDGAMDLVMRIYNDFKFDPHATDISTPVTQVFAMRRGVCQDFAHLALACFRALRIPARYVSGYLHTHPPVGRPKLQGADASHAWISVWSPEYGWIDLDPTNGILVRDEHVTVAFGRDYDDVSPISGVLRGGGEHTVDVGVDVNAVARATTD